MYFKTMGPVKLRNGFASKARMSVCMSAGDGRMLAAGRAESLYCEGQRERQGDDGPLQIYDRACGHTWTGSLVVKAVVWVGPYCWLRGSDLRTPAQRRHLPQDQADVMRWRKAERERLIKERLAIPADVRRRYGEQIAARLEKAIGNISGVIISAYWPFRGE